MTPEILAGLAVAGASGALARFLVDRLVQGQTEEAFPWGTLVVNLSGSLLVGLVTGAALYHALPKTPATWLAVGFCGSYTTFSTFAFETVRLLEEDQASGAVRNAVGTLLAGAAAAAVGLLLAAAV